MGIFELIISAVVSFFAGSFTTKISINSENDRERCNSIISAIDSLVFSFHGRFANLNGTQSTNSALFDYQIKSLVDDTTLLPIIGRSVFEREYTQIIEKIYKLSLDSPVGISQEAKEQLIKEMNSNAIDLKKTINCNRKDWRIFGRS